MRQRFFAQNGQTGAGRNRSGAAGEAVVIEVPPGTVVSDTETGEKLLDLVTDGQEAVLLLGGRGGKGNAHFRSSTHQAPRFSQPGEPGEERTLRVELQVIADIGFVGLPNAGKSTLLKVLTKADPKIGNYPFTTVIPNLGVLHQYEQDVVLADIPGLIAGASTGAGLGIRFLKHIARTRGLAFVIDIGDADMQHSYATLREELGAYSRELLTKDACIVLTKTDRIATGEVEATVLETFHRDISSDTAGELSEQIPIFPVCALTGEGLEELRQGLVALAQRRPNQEA